MRFVSLSRRLAVAGLLAAGPLLLTGTAQAANPVTPTLECQFTNGDGTYTAVFGYTNSDATADTFAVGGQNNFAPSPQDRGQPTVFQPGTHPTAFTVTWNGSGDLAWNLDGGNVHAKSTSTACTSPSQLPIVADSSAAAGALLVATIVGIIRFRNRRSRTVLDVLSVSASAATPRP